MALMIDTVNLHLSAEPEIQHCTTLRGGRNDGIVILHIGLRKPSPLRGDTETFWKDGAVDLFGRPEHLRSLAAAIEAGIAQAETKAVTPA